ncbi:MAG: DUF2271 domain-containing protein [Parahaliea sp.]
MLRCARGVVALSLLTLAGSGLAFGQSLSVELEVPRLDVAEYHRPYIALWVARADKVVAANLAVMYDLKLKDQEGEKWLKDMRQWWRRSGRGLDMPIDGLSGATRGPGRHQFSFDQRVADLPPGQYRLMVEAAREVGGRELLQIPFQWPPAAATANSVQGKEELGKITLSLSP